MNNAVQDGPVTDPRRRGAEDAPSQSGTVEGPAAPVGGELRRILCNPG